MADGSKGLLDKRVILTYLQGWKGTGERPGTVIAKRGPDPDRRMGMVVDPDIVLIDEIAILVGGNLGITASQMRHLGGNPGGDEVIVIVLMADDLAGA